MATPTPAQLAIATLYTAAFNRAPDASGFAFWLQASQQGAGLADLAGTFLGTTEGQTAYPPGLSSQAFVAAFYTSVFGRPADAGGLAFWAATLDSLGGANNTAAKAALMIRIIDIASTPLTAKPAELSDAAYAQTVADRARFVNKAEAGVYFAAELRSNDVALAKQMFTMITDNPASVTAARSYVDAITNPPPVVEPPVVVPPPALTSADDAPTIASKLSGYGGSSATADTTDMDAGQLMALAAGARKLAAGGLSGALALNSTVTVTEATDLLAKYSGTTASANALNMDSAYLAVLGASAGKFGAASIATPTLVLNNTALTNEVTEALLSKATGALITATGATADEQLSIVNHIGNVATGGINGTFALLGNLDATQLTSLLGKLHANARVTADVSFMGASQLAVLAAKPLALDANALTGSLHLSAPLSATAVSILLNRYNGVEASLVASAAVGSDVLNAVVAAVSKVAGISGNLTILSDVSVFNSMLLVDKYTGSTASINASQYNSTQLQSLSTYLNKLATVSEAQLALSNTWLTSTVLGNFLAKSANASIDAANADYSQIVPVALFINGVQTISNLALSSTYLSLLSNSQIGDLLSKSSGATLQVTGLSGAKVDTILGALSHVADGGLSGTLSIGPINGAGPLNTKLAAGATLNVTGTGAGDIIDLDGLTKSAYIVAGAGADTISLGSVKDTVFLGGVAETRTTGFSKTNGTTDYIDKILFAYGQPGSPNNDVLRLSTAPDAFGDGLTFAAGAGTRFDGFAHSGTNINTFEDIYTLVNTTRQASLQGSTSNLMECVIVTFTGGGHFGSKSFLLINDRDRAFTEADTIIEISGSFAIFEFGTA